MTASPDSVNPSVRVTIDSRIRIEVGDLDETVDFKLRQHFTHKNPKREAMKRSGSKGWWGEPEVIATWSHDGEGRLTLPRGGMTSLRAVLAAHGLTMRLHDARTMGDPTLDQDYPESSVNLWVHQERIVQACIAKQNCLVKAGTGSGKTTALIALFARLKIPCLVLVHSNALLDQWKRRSLKELGVQACDLGVIQGSRVKLAPLTIATAASFKKHVGNPKIRNYFGAVFADEVHLFAAASFFACIDPMPAKYRVGVSDDQRRKDKKEFLIYDVFGAVACEVKDAELIAARHVLDVECLVIPTEFEAPWYGVSVEKDDDKSPDFGRLVREMAGDPARQALVTGVMHRELQDGRQLLVMAHEREHVLTLGQIAAKAAKSGYLVGGADYKSEFKRSLDGLEKGEIRAGIGTFQACGTGIDIPTIEVAIAATPCMNNRQRFRQGRGRACRAPAGKDVARFYVFWDRKVFGLRHLQNVASWNKTTFVWDGASWVPVREYLKRQKA